ncbi:alpha/beta hydrolase [Chitinophaga nivalis]|uniref:Alpha/beta hydrolase n=1 Tax=Chitinophaga nivalis TaxID=2991709 RepID=A0ABT3IS29_9BACT|nr:alpha/beta hydrolase [Chitinophaga nivalis]MCW3463541.1 alpha/beta hydrolase [Chitinophaga nivalis]MCW3486769.1 alpha/beta hydrolase [Chitinophaga nivalis]
MKRKILRILKWTFLLFLCIFFFRACIPSKQDTESIKPRHSTKYWDLKTGSKIAYTFIEGKGNKKPYPVIYLHGGPGGYVHSKVIEVLGQLSEDGFDVYLYDQIGGGLSARLKNVNEYTATRHQKDLEAIVSLLKAEKVILVGQSWGGALATLFTADNPNKVDKIILTCPGAVKPVNDSVEKLKAPLSLNLKDPIDVNGSVISFLLKPRYIAIRVWALLGKKIASDAEADSYLNKMAEEFTKGLVYDSSKTLTEEGGGGGYCNIKTPTSYRRLADPRPKLINNNIPVLIIKGQYDNIPWGNTNEYKDIFKNSQLKIIEKAGHDIYIEKPDEYLQAMQLFLIKRS